MNAQEPPILFSGAMMRAHLQRTKRQTRRLVKGAPQDAGCTVISQSAATPDLSEVLFFAGSTPNSEGLASVRNPYGTPGHRLWTKETWNALYPVTGDMPHYFHELGAEHARALRAQGAQPSVIYRASPEMPGYPTQDDREAGFRWVPSIFQGRWATRLLLDITHVRAERLQDISEADARAEGVETWMAEEALDFPTYAQAYRALWERINGTASWAANPWVYVIEYDQVPA